MEDTPSTTPKTNLQVTARARKQNLLRAFHQKRSKCCLQTPKSQCKYNIGTKTRSMGFSLFLIVYNTGIIIKLQNTFWVCGACQTAIMVISTIALKIILATWRLSPPAIMGRLQYFPLSVHPSNQPAVIIIIAITFTTILARGRLVPHLRIRRPSGPPVHPFVHPSSLCSEVCNTRRPQWSVSVLPPSNKQRLVGAHTWCNLHDQCDGDYLYAIVGKKYEWLVSIKNNVSFLASSVSHTLDTSVCYACFWKLSWNRTFKKKFQRL